MVREPRPNRRKCANCVLRTPRGNAPRSRKESGYSDVSLRNITDVLPRIACRRNLRTRCYVRADDVAGIANGSARPLESMALTEIAVWTGFSRVAIMAWCTAARPPLQASLPAGSHGRRRPAADHPRERFARVTWRMIGGLAFPSQFTACAAPAQRRPRTTRSNARLGRYEGAHSGTLVPVKRTTKHAGATDSTTAVTLTENQRQILLRLFAGSRVDEIATATRRRPSTIANTLRLVRTQLGARRDLDLRRECLRRQLVALDDIYALADALRSAHCTPADDRERE
jgi:hypothetical protein